MNGWGLLFLMASIAAVFSVPLILFAVLMRLVGTISTRALAGVFLVDAVLWSMAAFDWWYG
jgi:hypothetical protein